MTDVKEARRIMQEYYARVTPAQFFNDVRRANPQELVEALRAAERGADETESDSGSLEAMNETFLKAWKLLTTEFVAFNEQQLRELMRVMQVVTSAPSLQEFLDVQLGYARALAEAVEVELNRLSDIRQALSEEPKQPRRADRGRTEGKSRKSAADRKKARA